MNTINPVIFREYDVRGVYNKELNEHVARMLGRALVTFLKDFHQIDRPTLTVAYDARLSGPSLSRAVATGMMESGAHVLNLGLVTTPVSYFSTWALKDVKGGIMVTGSHNPPDYNGFKISALNSTIFGEKIQKIREIIVNEKFINGEGTEEPYDILPEYVERHKKEFGNIGDIKVVVDCGNGAAGAVVRRLYEACGLKPAFLFEQPDGHFPNHHPDPTVKENLVALIQKVKETGATLGIGFDGDADRIGVVDHNGQVVLGDDLMVIIARHLLSEKKGLKIIGDVKCSDRLYNDVAQSGGQPIMWKTGHSLIKEKIKVEKAPFGGELSGHFFFADRNFGYDDAPYAGLRLLEIIAKTGKNLPQLLQGLPTAFNTPEIRLDTTEEKKISIVKKLQSTYSKDTADYKVNFIDGVRISYKDGWALIRSSNTQPVVVLRFESNTQKGLLRIQSEIENIVNPLL